SRPERSRDKACAVATRRRARSQYECARHRQVQATINIGIFSRQWKWTTKLPTAEQRSEREFLSTLRLDDRWGNVFGRSHVDTMAQFTVTNAVKKIDRQADEIGRASCRERVKI